MSGRSGELAADSAAAVPARGAGRGRSATRCSVRPAAGGSGGSLFRVRVPVARQAISVRMRYRRSVTRRWILGCTTPSSQPGYFQLTPTPRLLLQVRLCRKPRADLPPEGDDGVNPSSASASADRRLERATSRIKSGLRSPTGPRRRIGRGPPLDQDRRGSPERRPVSKPHQPGRSACRDRSHPEGVFDHDQQTLVVGLGVRRRGRPGPPHRRARWLRSAGHSAP